MKHLAGLALLFLCAGQAALAQEPGAAAVPGQVRALDGCWKGSGAVMDKPVTITLTASPIVERALFLVEADSHATADPTDRYAAHLIFGGKGAPTKGAEPAAISGFWADSFGGDYTALGAGSTRPDGFEIAYAYPDATYVNRWTLKADRLDWTITAKTSGQADAVFAHYELAPTTCPGAKPAGPIR